jgi:hypothetical protein
MYGSRTTQKCLGRAVEIKKFGVAKERLASEQDSSASGDNNITGHNNYYLSTDKSGVGDD